MQGNHARRIPLSLRTPMILSGLAVLWVAIAHASADKTQPPQTNLGIEGVIEIRWDGPSLQPRSDTNARLTPIEIRLAGPTTQGDATLYQVHYIGTRAGRYDLREYIQRRDGKPIVGLSPMLVEVVEVLPQNYVGELAAAPDPALPRPWPYRTLLAIGGVVWLALAIRWFVRRISSRPRPSVSKLTAEPSLADRLQPLVEAGLAGRLSAAQKAQLEQLLIGYWRSRLGGEGMSAFELLRRMRQDPVAGELLTQLEAWLHCPPRPGAVNVQQLLMPYRNPAPLLRSASNITKVAPAMEPQA